MTKRCLFFCENMLSIGRRFHHIFHDPNTPRAAAVERNRRFYANSVFVDVPILAAHLANYVSKRIHRKRAIFNYIRSSGWWNSLLDCRTIFFRINCCFDDRFGYGAGQTNFVPVDLIRILLMLFLLLVSAKGLSLRPSLFDPFILEWRRHKRSRMGP